MSATYQDKFNREDGPIGSNYLIPCGAVSIADEAVIPVGLSGASPDTYLPTQAKTQVLMVSEDMDSSDYIVRGVWARDQNPPTGGAPLDVESDPSFTLLARMTKDPLIVDLGEDESPYCYDQGYGLRITCPLDGSAPILKLIKFQPIRRAPGLNRPASAEPDGATILAMVTLQAPDLNVNPTWLAAQSLTQPSTGTIPYQGFWQDMRLRIRRADSMVIMDGYLNDRHMNESIITFTDKRDPLWGVIGRPGFDFLSAITNVQPAGTSPYSLVGDPLMRCGLFSTQTIKDFTQPVIVSPDNRYTYTEVTKRVILLVEKNGDAKYNATAAGRTKLSTYLQFVTDTESHIIRKLGAWRWLWRESAIYFKNGIANYELPEDCGLIDMIRPGNFSGPPLTQVPMIEFRKRYGSVAGSGGPPRLYMLKGQSVNNRQEILVFPTPIVLTSPSTGKQIEVSAEADPYMMVEYYARRIQPNDPDRQIPYIPQEHMDVLIWGAAAHAMILDTDPENTNATAQTFKSKLEDLVREQYRNMSNNAPEVMRCAGYDTPIPTPLTRVDQLSGLGWLP
jgi:hypothetical protein